MIGEFFNFLANTVFGFLNGLIDIFPAMPINADELETLAGVDIVGTIIAWVNWLLPIEVAATIIGLWANAMLLYLGIKLAMKTTAEVV